MPQTREGHRTYELAKGLFDKPNPLLITDGHAAAVENVNFDALSIEESRGMRAMNRVRPKMGGVRFRPGVRRDSVQKMQGWKDGYGYAPLVYRLKGEPNEIQISARLERDPFYPVSSEGLGLVSSKGSLL